MQSNYQSLTALKNAHTAIHQAIDLLNKESFNLSKQKQSEAIRTIANSLANM
jgi:hypothetical protein